MAPHGCFEFVRFRALETPMKPKVFLLSLLAAASLLLSGCDKPLFPSSPAPAAAPLAQTPAATAPAPQVAQGPRQLLPDFATIVEANGKAVVNITVTKAARSGARAPVGDEDESNPLFEFFRRFGIPTPRGGVPGQGQGPQMPMQGRARASSSSPTATSSPTRTWSRTRTK